MHAFLSLPLSFGMAEPECSTLSSTDSSFGGPWPTIKNNLHSSFLVIDRSQFFQVNRKIMSNFSVNHMHQCWWEMKTHISK